MKLWISIEERLPEAGSPIWARFSKKNGEPRKVNPVLEGDFGVWAYGGNSVGFIFGKHRNALYPPDYCRQVGLTHWQPRTDATRPSPEISSPSMVARTGEEEPKRPYRLSAEGLESKREKMREYWRRRKAIGDGENVA